MRKMIVFLGIVLIFMQCVNPAGADTYLDCPCTVTKISKVSQNTYRVWIQEPDTRSYIHDSQSGAWLSFETTHHYQLGDTIK